jgi:acetoacetyl-CoA reductase
MSTYGMTKAAVLHLTSVAAIENASNGIRVNAICPGPVDTPMLRRLPADRLAGIVSRVRLGRLGGCDEVADAIHWLCTTDHLTGVVLPMDGGEHIA